MSGANGYAGAAWLREVLPDGKAISPLGERVADLLGELWHGLYHFEGCRRTDWGSEQWIRVTCQGNDLATHDFDGLTRLVFLCHEAAIRCQISPCNMQRVELMFHDRSEANWHGTHPHPTLDAAVARFQGRHRTREQEAV